MKRFFPRYTSPRPFAEWPDVVTPAGVGGGCRGSQGWERGGYPPRMVSWQKVAHLALCLQPPAKTNALLDLPRVCKGTKKNNKVPRGRSQALAAGL